MSTQETVFYQDESVLITNTRAVLGAKTYSMANITSVSTGIIPANRVPGIVVVAVGGLSTLCCGSLIPVYFFGGVDYTSKIIGTSVTGVGALIGLLILAGGIALAIMSKLTYVVRIGSASGEANALTSKHQDSVDENFTTKVG